MTPSAPDSTTVPGGTSSASRWAGSVRTSSMCRSLNAVAAPGHGVTARWRFHTVVASSAKSTIPSRLPSFFA